MRDPFKACSNKMSALSTIHILSTIHNTGLFFEGILINFLYNTI